MKLFKKLKDTNRFISKSPSISGIPGTTNTWGIPGTPFTKSSKNLPQLFEEANQREVFIIPCDA